MITYLKNVAYGMDQGELPVDGQLIEIACLSTDTKPTEGIVTGSLALEVDTGDIYAFDGSSETWNKL